ncbi:MAG: FAD-binding oxidoreductase, partial [Burkholderiales bacterium]
MNELLDALRQIVGTPHVLTHDDPTADLSAWEIDWCNVNHGLALVVVRPGTTKEVAEVVKLCARHQAALGVSIVPQGGNTGLVLGSTPDASGLQIVLSLQRMNAVRSMDAANLT